MPSSPPPPILIGIFEVFVDMSDFNETGADEGGERRHREAVAASVGHIERKRPVTRD